MKIKRIKCAAIKDQDKIYEGQKHCDIGLSMIRDNVCPPPYHGGQAQGFVTEDGLFVNRVCALSIAIRAGQVVPGKTIHPRELFSEDLRSFTC